MVLLHGYEDDPQTFFAWVDTIDPTRRFSAVAPRAPFETPNGPTWFATDPATHPDQRLDVSLEALSEFVTTESVALGHDPREAVIVGYSQGGAAAQALAFRAETPVRPRAIAVVSSYLPPDDGFTWDFSAAAGITNVLIVHGIDDDQVPVLHGRSTSKVLARNGIETVFIEVDAGHHLEGPLLKPVTEWLEKADNIGL